MKRLMSFVLALALCAGMSGTSLAAEFSDVPAGHTFHDAIAWCAENGIVGGYADGTFKPANTVTNASFVAMLTRRFFPEDVVRWDIATTRSYMGAFGPNLAAANTVGILEGTSFRTSFSTPESRNKHINRYDMAQLAANVMSNKGYAASESGKSAAATQIADYASIPDKYRDAVLSVYTLGIIGGYGDGGFKGDHIMNRGQAAVVIYRLAQYMDATEPSSAPARTLSNGKEITEENVVEIMNQLREQYPDGQNGYDKYGSGNKGATGKVVRTYNNHKSGRPNTSTTAGCGGWAARVFDAVWGYDVTLRRVEGGYDDARIGDLGILVNEKGELYHVCVVSDRGPSSNNIDLDVVFTTDAATDRDGVYGTFWDGEVQKPGKYAAADWDFHFYTAYPD